MLKEFYNSISAVNPNDSLEGQYCVNAVIDVLNNSQLSQIVVMDKSLAVKLETYLPILMSFQAEKVKMLYIEVKRQEML